MGAPAGRYDTICDQGATYERIITLRDAGASLLNLTNFTGQMQIRPTAASSTVIKSLTTGNGGIILGGSAGTVTLTIPAADTASLTPGTYVYDLNLTSPDGKVTKPIYGNFQVRAGVTR